MKHNDLESRFFEVLKVILMVTIILLVFSCSDDEGCAYDDKNQPCNYSEPNTTHSGWTVATCHSGFVGGAILNGPVAVIYDTSLNSLAPIANDWGTASSPVPSIHPSNWNNTELGQVFGIAIDDSENIFLATSDIYHFDNSFSLISSTSTNSATIYKFNAPAYTTQVFVTLPSNSDALNDIGNIAYDKLNNQLFATNLEDGKIYRITNLSSPTGTIIETYDPWVADNNLPVIVAQDERIWGIGVNYEAARSKIYFPRITSSTREMYSVTLNLDGSFPNAGSEIIEIPNVPGLQPIISDIAFSSDTNKMLVSERGDPHRAKVFSYSRSAGWSFNIQYFVGANAALNGENSAGGVDFAYAEVNGDIDAVCDSFFWATGNYMSATNSSFPLPNFLYGLEGINYSGNNSFSLSTGIGNNDTDIFIDFDGSGSTAFKRTIGDVEVFDANECFDPCN